MLVNLTPHPIRVYATGTPDRIDPGEHEPTVVIEPSADLPAARLGVIDLGTQNLGLGVPVEYVEFGHIERPPPRPVDGVWYVVSLVVALAQLGQRNDLLVPYLEVRNLEGTVIGCRLLARPV
jgi:hypothetical protein